jgi:hypothetical protein
MVDNTKRDRADRDAGGGYSRSRHNCRNWQFAAIQSVAPLVGTEVNAINVRDASEIERAVAAFAGSSNGGLIVTGSGLAFIHRNLLVTLAAQHKLPAAIGIAPPSSAA